MTLKNLSDMNRYEIIYRHMDMHTDYRGYTIRFARDQKQAVGYICSGKPDKNGYGVTKKGAKIQILEVNQIPYEQIPS